MSDFETEKIVCKLETIQAVIDSFFANDQLIKDDDSEVKDKLEQMEQLIADLPDVNGKLTTYWYKKVTAFWKALVYENFNDNETQRQDGKDKIPPAVLSNNTEEPVILESETVEIDSFKENNNNNNQTNRVKSESLKTSKHSFISKQSLEYISKYILPNRQEPYLTSIEDDQQAVIDKEENNVIVTMESDLASLPIIQGPFDIEAIQNLHVFIEKMRLYDPSVMYSQQSASIYSTALEKLSPDQKESYLQLHSTNEFSKNNYRCWCNLLIFLKQQIVNYHTEQLQNVSITGSFGANRRTCYYCKDIGHFLLHCPLRLSSLCTICFNYGHSQKYCNRYGFQKWFFLFYL